MRGQENMMRYFFSVALMVGLAGCGGGGNTTPVTPSTPAPTPAPIPTPTPNAYALACGAPLPRFEDAYGMGIKVQLEPTAAKKILNTSPAIKSYEYCQEAGSPGFLICNTRKEDNPERVPCDHYLTGISDEGVPGPNWFQEIAGQLVKCGTPGTSCRLKPENQYLLDIFAVGKYVACGGKGSPGQCGECTISTMERSKVSSLGGLCRPE
jgi:hypothetical protein